MLDLNDVIPVDSGWVLVRATDINDHGQVVGRGRIAGQTRAFLLDYIGPPECGDGTLQAGEECDDGNIHGGDGCNANCQLETPIPVVSEWGLVTMTLFVLAAGTIVLRRHSLAFRAAS